MGSTIAFLVYACALLTLLEAWKDSKPCVFPFIYGNRSYSSCTTEGSKSGKPWCATTHNYDKNHQWRWCETQDSKPCVFPFIYGNRSYPSCTTEGSKSGKPWCATTHNYDKNHQWKWCETQEYGGNSGGKRCQIPFIYRMETYYSCTTKNSHKLWCATTGNYDRDKSWSYCADTRKSDHPCVFPFKYKNTSHITCITEDSLDGTPWCSQTKDYDVDKKRIPCEASEGICIFPFIYKGKKYCACTRDGTVNRQLWCATTSNYDIDGKWRTCVLQEFGGNANGEACVIPFIYKEEIYYNCTNEDEPSGKLWCATTQSYDNDGKWTYCADAASPAAERNQNKTCVFPFTYKGTNYTDCTKDGSLWRRSWCSLTSDYDAHKTWMYCDFSDREKGCSPQP